jgi:hypothetical protein
MLQSLVWGDQTYTTLDMSRIRLDLTGIAIGMGGQVGTTEGKSPKAAATPNHMKKTKETPRTTYPQSW